MKNKIKRSLSVLVAVCVIAALSVAAAPAGKAQAATRKKAALSRKSVSVATGKTRKLTVKNANKKVIKDVNDELLYRLDPEGESQREDFFKPKEKEVEAR